MSLNKRDQKELLGTLLVRFIELLLRGLMGEKWQLLGCCECTSMLLCSSSLKENILC
jgi:hypothetical protein